MRKIRSNTRTSVKYRSGILRPAGQGTTLIHLLWARAVRDFGDGFIAVLLPIYLIALGLSPLDVGLVAFPLLHPAWVMVK